VELFFSCGCKRAQRAAGLRKQGYGFRTVFDGVGVLNILFSLLFQFSKMKSVLLGKSTLGAVKRESMEM
jgi:hypothetical protein